MKTSKYTFNGEINWGHIVTLFALAISAISWILMLRYQLNEQMTVNIEQAQTIQKMQNILDKQGLELNAIAEKLNYLQIARNELIEKVEKLDEHEDNNRIYLTQSKGVLDLQHSENAQHNERIRTLEKMYIALNKELKNIEKRQVCTVVK